MKQKSKPNKKNEKVKSEKNTPPGKPINWGEVAETTKQIVHKGSVSSMSFINGVVGDHLDVHGAPIAIAMSFRKNGKVVSLSRADLKKDFPKATNKIALFIHGLISDELWWNYSKSNETYGSHLEKDLGFTPFYLRYNSGKHVSENGKQLSSMIEELIENYPTKVKEIVLVGHSMGGLVLRSACHYAKQNKAKWVSALKNVIFLGSPHQGAPLEKLGNLATTVLKFIPFNPFVKLTRRIINLRSSGIKDLRHGYVVDEDWEGKDPDDLFTTKKTNIPLLKGVSYYVITGTLHEDPKHVINFWLGDILVREPSALGKAWLKPLQIPFDENNHKEFPGIIHHNLTRSPEIYHQIRKWLN